MNYSDHMSSAGAVLGSLWLRTSLEGTEFAPPAEKTSNDPGLNENSVFEDKPAANKLSQHWILAAIIGILLIGIFWYFASDSGR